MVILFNTLIVIFTTAFMEGVAWFIHKYLFHGPLWFLHKSHHEAGHKRWEWNDLFSLFFTFLAIYLSYIGRTRLDIRLWIGIGITCYGFLYFLFHDVFVHNRLKSFNTQNKYLLNLRRAHKIHHKSLEKQHSESFGFIYVPKKYRT